MDLRTGRQGTDLLGKVVTKVHRPRLDHNPNLPDLNYPKDASENMLPLFRTSFNVSV
jgi:hypothetical protein